ncbi:MAG: M1 family metallopeptidase [Bacteroidales bacterium]|nr:M1 family metallopeptidase [Bacteroidales bacterium]
MLYRIIYILCLFLLIFYKTVSGQEYFQQEVNYKINVKLDDKNNLLIADETIEYINNSPDTLKFIYFHLWPNAYKNNQTAFAKQYLENGYLYFKNSEEKDRGYIDSLDFKVNNENIFWEYDSVYIDICKLHLNKPLKPGEKIIITTPFYVKIPISFSRLAVAQNAYQISQWYPKPAVYDKYGWHQFPYLDVGEFYSEFGLYDVSITIPKNYIVAATGNLMNDEEKEWLENKVTETEKITNFDNDKINWQKSVPVFKTLRYTENNIHDFAWFANKKYHVLKGEVELPHSKRKVTTWAMFTNIEGNLWKRSIEYINDAVYYYSLWYGDYPYNNCTAVFGESYGGMEYPTITIIDEAGSDFSLETIIIHEVGHNWFYGVLGFNEREHPWLDEGINTFSEVRYINTKYPDNKIYDLYLNEKTAKFLGIEKYQYKSINEFYYLIKARINENIASSLHSEKYIETDYFISIYSKVALDFNYLMNYLGEEKFDNIMQEFYEKWKFKHPYPDDIKNIFEEKTGENLDWFFEDIIKTTKKNDYKISKMKNEKLLIKNKGQIISPFSITSLKNNKIQSTEWYQGFNEQQWINIPDKECDKIIIDYSLDIPDINRKNNIIKTFGIFKKAEPFKLKFLGIIENPDNTQINFSPLIGWNNYNKLMIGSIFYGAVIPTQKLEYQILPFYSYENKDFAGYSNFNYYIFPNNNFIQNIKIGLSSSRYAFYYDNVNFQKFKPNINIEFKKKNSKSTKENYLYNDLIYVTNSSEKLYNDSTVYSYFYNGRFTHENNRTLNPYSVNLNIQAGKGFVKSWIESFYTISYKKPKKGFNIRLFAGKFLYNADYYYGNYNFRLSGWTGQNDYTFENVYIGRMENIINESDNHLLSQQFVKNDGGFSVYTLLGQTNNWLASINLNTTLPFLIPLKPYLNLAAYNYIHNSPKSIQYVFESGIEISIIPDIFEIYFPVLMSEDIKYQSDFITDNYWQKIRFILNFNELNPFKLIKEIDL